MGITTYILIVIFSYDRNPIVQEFDSQELCQATVQHIVTNYKDKSRSIELAYCYRK